ncbi:NACHT domain-containing protein [Desulfolutivibrio sulfoxidireducens]|uniref:NACHT domain-containing protein n=1 Tax=Desulfolutivibrio sulfoxidireducens TaxID=2773299 RepID=UPI00159DC735|nr:hypothetical protein [Desulfolutivibrio sulfoxidireducens]QLA16273.1 hypothetical protein GD605_09160 [Desulfolutivibrio sulfoxidireducens]
MKTTQNKRQPSGGASPGGGMNFQAAVTAITYIHMARGCPLLWLNGVVDDVPTAIEVETSGAGDDLRLLLKDARVVEVQAKKGLQSGSILWDALNKLARAVTTDADSFGVLVVSPSSSNTITNYLAKDIIRIGDGRTDDLSDIATKFLGKLNLLSIPAQEACSRIRIQTISATALDQEAIRTAHAYLAQICADDSQIGEAWEKLYNDASLLTELKGRRDISSLLRILISSHIRLVESNTKIPALLLTKLSRWTIETNRTFSIIGVNTLLSIDKAWIPLTAIVQEHQNSATTTLADELQRYQEWESRSKSRDDRSVDPETLGRFVPRAIVVAGPGMGKTTLLKRIALRYSEDFIPVLRVKLSSVAARMRAGWSFEESIFLLGLDGSGISATDAQQVKFSNWLLLCDGLDECGTLQGDVAAGVSRFAAGHPDCRILVTTRPVGYSSTHFTGWRHYSLPALDTWNAHAHAANLIESIAPPDSDLQQNALMICRSELDDTNTANIVGRTPLLLGLAASIIGRGKKLGNTRKRLFEQVFELIDEIPNARIPERPAVATVLRYFLDMLGWEIINQPLRSINETITQCADHLEHETGARRLAAIGDAESYLSYWQDVGIIERVGHNDQQTFAFIHKSFGEYAAARHLCNLPQEVQTAIFTEVVDVPAWREVLRFSGMMGLADQIASSLPSDFQISAATVKHIGMTLELIAEADPPPDLARRTRIFEFAFKVAVSDRRLLALEFGQPLVEASRRFPDEVISGASALVGSEHPWTRLIAWGCLVAAGPDYYVLDDLVEALPSCIDAVGQSRQSSLGGGIIFSSYGREFEENFIIDACTSIIDHASPQIADDIVPAALNHSNIGSFRFLAKVGSLLKNKGKNYHIKKLNEPIPSIDFPDDYFEHKRIMWEVIFEALNLPEQIPCDTSQSQRSLLHLSAFIETTQIGKVPASDIWVWSQSYDREATIATLQAFLDISGIDLEMLKQDAMHIRRFLNNSDKDRINVFTLAVSVDPQPVDWSRAKGKGFDPYLIEKAISHPSIWIKYLATNLLEQILEKYELESAVRRLFETGRGFTLWAACGLASELDGHRATELVLERLGKPLVQGCEYLFDLLREHIHDQTDQLIKPITDGLLTGDVKTALAAAKLAADVAKPHLNCLVPVLKEAQAHWLVHEKPYPRGGGIIPDSPRASIIDALVTIDPPSYEEIKIMLKDVRSDVRDIGVKKLIRRLQNHDGERTQFFKDIEFGELPPLFLRKVLSDRIQLAEEDLTEAELLLKNEDKHIRYAAMTLLSENYMSQKRMRKYAKAMTDDSEQEIKERAFVILDKI